MTRRICEAGRNLIKRWEALRLDAYQCEAGVWTIGWGHTRTAKPGMTITEAEAEALLSDDLDEAERAVARLFEVPLSDHQHAVLVSWVFNIGVGNAAASTLRKHLNAGRYDDVPEQLARWKYTTVGGHKVVSKGLVNRRAAEADLWAHGSMEAPLPVPRPSSPERSNPAKSKTMQASAGQIVTGGSAGAGAVGYLDGDAQKIVIVGGGLVVLLGMWIMRERLRAWGEGWT